MLTSSLWQRKGKKPTGTCTNPVGIISLVDEVSQLIKIIDKGEWKQGVLPKDKLGILEE